VAVAVEVQVEMEALLVVALVALEERELHLILHGAQQLQLVKIFQELIGMQVVEEEEHFQAHLLLEEMVAEVMELMITEMQ
jgi:hypothetical protein